MFLKKLEKSVEEGNLYEALQMYRTIYFRYLSQKKFDDLKNLMIHGATIMITKKHNNEGIDLAQLLINVYKDNKIPATQENLEPILKIIQLHLDNLDIDQTPNEMFLRACIRWSAEWGPSKEGDSQIHNMIAKFFHKQKNYGKAQKYFLRGTLVEEFTVMVSEWSDNVEIEESDLVLAKIILQYLCLQNLKDANILFLSFLKIKPHFPETPMVNFLRFLLVTLERADAYSLFDMLRKRYSITIERDPKFNQYLDHIGWVYYKVKPTQVGLGGMINELMKGLFAAPSDSLEDTESSLEVNNNSNIQSIEFNNEMVDVD